MDLFLYNHPSLKELRQTLRGDATKAERMLWEKLKGKQLDGLKFRRQYGIGRYIVDFYCPELRLAIEIDGDSHLEEGAQEYDMQREAYIKAYDVQFLRFANGQVYSNLDEILEQIHVAAKTLKKSPPK